MEYIIKIGVSEIFTEIKNEAKEIIAKNKWLFTLSIILFISKGVIFMMKPIWIGESSKEFVYIITELSVLVLFPLTLGYIKLLLQVKEGLPFQLNILFYAYKSPQLLIKAIGLGLITKVSIDTINFVITNDLIAFPLGKLLSFILLVVALIIYMYLVLTNYLFVMKSELGVVAIIIQSIKLMRGKVWDYIALVLSFILWFFFSNFILGLTGIEHQNTLVTQKYLIYYGIYFLYTGCFYLYFDLAMLLFAQRIIEDAYNPPNPFENKFQSMLDYHHDSKTSDEDDEMDLDYHIDEVAEEKQKQFEAYQVLSQEYITFTDSAGDLHSYDVDERFDTYDLYFFLKEYINIRSFFKKTYREAVNSYVSDSAERSLHLNNNTFRLVVTILDKSNRDGYEIKFKLFINS